MTSTMTNTTSWVITKYSRCYSTATVVSPTDWQHNTTPTILLHLDQSFSPTGSVTSIRLRILWQMAGSCDPDRHDQVAFEDLDLLHYSTAHSIANTLGVPLRVVYQDRAVGLRYMHPFPPRQENVTFRRFQISFTDSQSVAEFIQRIASVCPCHANPGTTAPPKPQPVHEQLSISLISQPSSDRLSVSATHVELAPELPAKRPKLTQENVHSRSLPDSQYLSKNKPSGYVSTLEQSSQSELDRRDASINQFPINRDHAPGDQLRTLVPPVSDQTADPITMTLRRMPELYTIAPDELEKMVGQVIREPGFVDFLGNLENMWRIRTFIRR